MAAAVPFQEAAIEAVGVASGEATEVGSGKATEAGSGVATEAASGVATDIVAATDTAAFTAVMASASASGPGTPIRITTTATIHTILTRTRMTRTSPRIRTPVLTLMREATLCTARTVSSAMADGTVLAVDNDCATRLTSSSSRDVRPCATPAPER